MILSDIGGWHPPVAWLMLHLCVAPAVMPSEQKLGPSHVQRPILCIPGTPNPHDLQQAACFTVTTADPRPCIVLHRWCAETCTHESQSSCPCSTSAQCARPPSTLPASRRGQRAACSSRSASLPHTLVYLHLRRQGREAPHSMLFSVPSEDLLHLQIRCRPASGHACWPSLLACIVLPAHRSGLSI